MKIAVIGAGVAGLAAGRELVKAGHEVVVYEKSNGFGGRLATRYAGEGEEAKLDHGVSYFQAESSEFQKLVVELMDKNLVKPWEGKFAQLDGHNEISVIENHPPYYIAPDGMNNVGKYLARLLDVRLGEKVGGLTHLGEHRTRKRAWMLNFTTRNTESADAVIIATPSKQAYALLNTTIDEIETLKLVREIDEVEYDHQFSYIAGYGSVDKPYWNGLYCDDEVIAWISNEATKREDNQEATLVVHTTPEFTARHMDFDHEQVAEIISERLAGILGGWAGLPEWQQIHFWRYSQARNPLPHDFMEIRGNETPLALIGGYMNGNTVESAYLSGVKLGRHWAEAFKAEEVPG